MKKLLSALMASAVVLATSSGVAHAAVAQMVDVEIQGTNYAGAGVITNGFDSFAFNLVAGAGSGKSVAVFGHEASGAFFFPTFNYSNDASTAIGVSSGTSSAMALTSYANLYDGYMNANSAMSLSLSGLDANKNYELVVYSQREIGQTTTLSINGTQVISNASNLSALTQATAGNSLNGNYALITSGLTSNGSGVLSFTYQGQIDGFQVKELPVPEPASVVLLGIGGLLGSYRMRRSREQAAA
jgi:hypothetical protein